MIFTVYSETFSVEDMDYYHIPDSNIYPSYFKFIRIEYDTDMNPVYVFFQSNKMPYDEDNENSMSNYFFTRLDKNNRIKILIEEYYNNIEKDENIQLLRMDFIKHRTKQIIINVHVNTDMININTRNPAMLVLCNIIMNSKESMTVSDIGHMITTSSFLPDYDLNSNISKKLFNKKPNNFKIKLFDYQKKSILKMIDIEKGETLLTPRTFELEFGDVTVIWDPYYNKIVDNIKYCNITSNGGILADSMGLGKTVTMTGLLYYGSQATILPDTDDTIYSKATLVIVPSHLAKQWDAEYNKAMPTNSKKIIIILTKTQHEKVTYKDFREADMIIVTQQFLLNFKNYIEINYRRITPTVYCAKSRLEYIKNIFKNWKDTNMEIDCMNKPLFEFFHFHRVIVDEGHEIFEESLGNISLNRWILSFLSNLKSTYKWYVSGTPISRRLIGCMDFIDMKINFKSEDSMNEIIKIDSINYNRRNGCNLYHSNNICNTRRYPAVNIGSYMVTHEFIIRLLNNVMIRHMKEDVDSMICIPSYVEMVEWVELTEAERSIYDSKKPNSSKLTLQQLCCHPLIVESMKKMMQSSNGIVDLDKVQEMVIQYHKDQITIYTEKLEKNDSSNQAYHMLQSTYNSKIRESQFMLNILEKINDTLVVNKNDENIDDVMCVICYNKIDVNDKNILTSCGHLYCEGCIMTAIKYKAECPTCKHTLDSNSSFYRIDNTIKKNVEKKEDENPLLTKYGAKLGKLIQMIKTILTNNTNRIIVFSQWDNMLALIGKTLTSNGIGINFIKGNVHCRNSAISRFTADEAKETDRVIMLSLKNSASGTNLTEATHIFFVEPINMSRDQCKIIEGQAIGRACRLGQKNVVNVIRILCKNTIEEEIYCNVYNNNISV